MSNPHSNLSRRWFEEVWNQRRTATIDELLSAQCLGHMEGGEVPGIEAFKQVHAGFLTAFPDLQVRVEAIIADQDDVVIRWSASGTHLGEWFGVPPTQQRVSFRGISWHHYQGGQLSEGWDSWNQMALLHQLREAERASQRTGSEPS